MRQVPGKSVTHFRKMIAFHEVHFQLHFVSEKSVTLRPAARKMGGGSFYLLLGANSVKRYWTTNNGFLTYETNILFIRAGTKCQVISD